MPTISRFFGILIQMYFNDHAPPHFHAEYQDEHATFDLAGNLKDGYLHSATARRLVAEWAALHRSELEANWELARQGKGLNLIAPLE